MKNFSRFSILAVVLVALASTAGAVDFATNASVDIIDGVTIAQTTAMNFGVLVNNNGTVIVSCVDGTQTDAAHLISDATDISQGIFDVTSTIGSSLTAAVTAGSLPAGITLDTFTFSWAGEDAAADRTLVAATEELEVGASITLDRTATTATNGTPADLPYTLAVTFQ